MRHWVPCGKLLILVLVIGLISQPGETSLASARTLGEGWAVFPWVSGWPGGMPVQDPALGPQAALAGGEPELESGEVPETSVGMTGRIAELILPGPLLTSKPLDPSDPVVIRIADVNPHGTLTRYAIEYWGMEPGEYDLRDYLIPADGADAVPLKPIPVRIQSVMVVDNGHLNQLESTEVPWLGGYRLILALGAIGWVLITIGIFTVWRTPRTGKLLAIVEEEPLTWADRLRPLLEKSRNGELNSGEQAALERLLVSFWRERLQLGDQPAALALEQIKQDPQAGRLLNQLEQWLHRPNPDRSIDLGELLAPYEKEISE